MTEQVIQLEKVNKWYDDFHVLKDIDLFVDKGQKIVICGPSGSIIDHYQFFFPKVNFQLLKELLYHFSIQFLT